MKKDTYKIKIELSIDEINTIRAILKTRIERTKKFEDPRDEKYIKEDQELLDHIEKQLPY